MGTRPERKFGILVRNNHTVATNKLSASNIRQIKPLVLLEPRINSLLGRTRKRKRKKKLDNNKRKPRRKTKNKTRTSVKKKN